MLQLENPIKYDDIILVCIGDSVLIPTSLDERLKPYKEFQGKHYSIAKVIDILKDVRYISNIPSRGIYEFLNGKVLVKVVHSEYDPDCRLEIDFDDIFILDDAATTSMYEYRRKVFDDLKNKLFFNGESSIDKELIISNFDLLKYNLLHSIDDLRGFNLTQFIRLRFNNGNSSEIIFDSNISNIELINKNIYIVCQLPSDISLELLSEFLDDSVVIGVNLNLRLGIFNHIKIRLDSKYIDNNLNYVVTDNQNKNKYFNNTDILEKYIVNEVLHYFQLRRKIGISDFKFLNIVKSNIDKNQFDLVYVLNSINNPQLEYREKMLSINCRYGADDLSIKILIDNLNKRLNKNESYFSIKS